MKGSRHLWKAVALAVASLSCLTLSMGMPAVAQESSEDDPLRHLEWRNVGPVNMSGRVADVEGIPGNPRVVYVGSASGGVWKTVNGGTTFEPIFDRPAGRLDR